MKLAWFTPMDRRSAIGKVSVQICEELSRSHDVEIWCYETENRQETSVRVVPFSPERLDVSRLLRYDFVLYNMGNYTPYHWAIYEALQQFPGIVVLHDRTMWSFYYLYSQTPGRSDAASNISFRDRALLEHGDLGREAAEKFPGSSYSTNTNVSTALPMLHELLKNATAVFTHARIFTQELRNTFYGLIGYHYLPCEIAKLTTKPLPSDFTADGKLLILSTGIVHAVKRIDRVAEMLLNNKDIRDRVRYVLIGEDGGAYGDQLRALAEGPLNGCLYMMGYQPDDVMEAYISAADLCVNLRYPNSEVCSLSLLEQMGAGKATIVLSSGIYGEMPDDTVIKIGKESELEDLERSIRRILDDRTLIQKTGDRAKEFVREHCSVQGYARSLCDFLASTVDSRQSMQFLDDTLTQLRDHMAFLGYTQEDLPDDIGDVQHIASMVYGATAPIQSGNVIGLWFGFPYEIPGLHREGITKFLCRLVSVLLETYPSLAFELWSYDANAQELLAAFHQSIRVEANHHRVRLVTEKNWMTALPVPEPHLDLPWNIRPENDNLADVAYRYSKASVFIPAILYLDNVLRIQRPVYVPAHDMFVKYCYEDFVAQDPNAKFRSRDIESRVNRMARRGALFVANSQTILEQQILPCIRGAQHAKISFVSLPDIMPETQEDAVSDEVLRKYKIERPYFFYPTQIRPHKNVGNLLKALHKLKAEGISVRLVLTGTLADAPEVSRLSHVLGLQKDIVSLYNVSNDELLSLYRYAAAIPVSTLMEGSFPGQATEAISVDAPVVLSNIAVVRERLETLGLTAETCGLSLFDPYDPDALANKLRYALSHREELLLQQQIFKDAMKRYTWDEAAPSYYQALLRAAGR